ncbi:hypothetical protein Purlil1_13105 [Purpureocillium lilacinum]|uniref:AB hydrolase-1 domain-containing protein n=1 Tax=Purpureocillium lilacinum TaxID=33203 RepID=A0ABR0BF22_PURLI|nr:hypothetical protein Purlil1_13105 [Purpureocillium lilacinum]
MDQENYSTYYPGGHITGPTPVPMQQKKTWFEAIVSPLAHVITSVFYPGNAGKIDYRYLDRKVSEGKDGYEPQSPDVANYWIKSNAGTTVGLHVYSTDIKPSSVKKVVLFFHGNTRSPRYMNPFLEDLAGNERVNGQWLRKNRKRVVIARDFPGYDLSSRVPYLGGSLETAATANDMAVYNWVIAKYPNAEITVVGRSIGTMGWVNLLPLDRVTRAVAIVPFADPAELVVHVATSKASACYLDYVPGVIFALNKVLRAACDVAFPRSREGSSPLVGFSPSAGISAWKLSRNKRILFFAASKDALVPFGDVERLARAAELQGAVVEPIVRLRGGHAALPTGNDLKSLQDFL